MSGSASFQEGEEVFCTRLSLLLQPHLPHQLCKPWVRVQGIECEVSFQPR
jgi:hypothetical protein